MSTAEVRVRHRNHRTEEARLAADVERLFEIVAEADFFTQFNRAATCYIDGRNDNIPLPIALTRGDVPGKNKIGQSRQCDVVCPPDA